MQPVLEPIQAAKFRLGGEIGRRLEAVTRQWILPAPFANPGMLEMFRQRDRQLHAPPATCTSHGCR